MILVVLTSHRLDCFSLCIKCLEKNTDLRVFEKIYVLGNELAPEHKAFASAFVGRHANAELVEFGPRGWQPLMQTQDMILRQHPDSIMVKIDEDVFVMPNWLEAMLLEYEKGRSSGCVLVSALVPNNQSGMRMLHEPYLESFADYAKFADTVFEHGISKNARYALWIWKKFMQGKLDLTRQGLLKNVESRRIDFYLNINCIMLNPEFLQAILPFAGSTDEHVINQALQMGNKLYGLVTPKAIAHHYSFGPQQELLDTFISMDDLEPILMNDGKLPEGAQYSGLTAVMEKELAADRVATA